jgi:hypothetical protein
VSIFDLWQEAGDQIEPTDDKGLGKKCKEYGRNDQTNRCVGRGVGGEQAAKNERIKPGNG